MTQPLYEIEISQVRSELAGLIAVLQREGVTRFLEVGSRYGGSLWRIANALPPGSLIVSCDSGRGMGGKKPGQMESLKSCVAALCNSGYRAHQITGDSQLTEIVEEVRAYGPFDAVFIDADHELPGVTLDWINYGAMARIVAFHDVGWKMPEGYRNPKVVEVPALWAELKSQHRHEEFIDPAGGNMGIGVLWHH
jgi:predicted O-methyltransferase YrrM